MHNGVHVPGRQQELAPTKNFEIPIHEHRSDGKIEHYKKVTRIFIFRAINISPSISTFL